MLDNLRETFMRYGEDGEREFLRFERIENPPSKSSDICAFLLLDRLAPSLSIGRPGDGIDILCSAEHDKVWLSTDTDKLAAAATEEDILYLVRCGVMYDDEMDSLAMFV